jgi:hypothetical protein
MVETLHVCTLDTGCSVEREKLNGTRDYDNHISLLSLPKKQKSDLNEVLRVEMHPVIGKA